MAVRPKVAAKLGFNTSTTGGVPVANEGGGSNTPTLLIVMCILIGGYIYYEYRKRKSAGASE